jgi:hypothetical protein
MKLKARRKRTPEEVERDVIAFISTETWVEKVVRLKTGWYAVTTKFIEPCGHSVMTYLYYWPEGDYWSVDDLENFEQEFCSQNPNDAKPAERGMLRACGLYDLSTLTFALQVDSEDVIAEAFKISAAQLTAYASAYFVLSRG